MNVCGITRDDLEFIADRSPYKHGFFTPGNGIPVVPVDRILTEGIDCLILLAWNFADEVIRQQREFEQRGGKFVVPVPLPRSSVARTSSAGACGISPRAGRTERGPERVVMAERILVVGAGFVGGTIARSLARGGGVEIALASLGGAPGCEGVAVVDFDADLPRIRRSHWSGSRRSVPTSPSWPSAKGYPHEDLRDVMLTNAVYPVELARWLRGNADCRCFVQVGTCFEYGHPVAEELLAESAPPRPFNIYGASKLAACHGLRGFSESTGSQVLHVRPFTLFGPGETPNRLTPTIFDAYLDGTPAHFSDGLQQRDFVYSADAGSFFVKLLEARRRLPRWAILNLCTGKGTRIRDFVRTAAEVLRGRFGETPLEPTSTGRENGRRNPKRSSAIPPAPGNSWAGRARGGCRTRSPTTSMSTGFGDRARTRWRERTDSGLKRPPYPGSQRYDEGRIRRDPRGHPMRGHGNAPSPGDRVHSQAVGQGRDSRPYSS